MDPKKQQQSIHKNNNQTNKNQPRQEQRQQGKPTPQKKPNFSK